MACMRRKVFKLYLVSVKKKYAYDLVKQFGENN